MVSQYIGETFKDLNNMNYRLRISQSIVRQQWEFFTGFCCLNVKILCIFMRNLQGLNSVNHTALIVLIPLCNIKRLKQLYSPRCSDVLRHSALLLFMACIERRLKVWGFPVNCNFLLTGFLSCKAWFHLGFLRKWSSGVFFLVSFVFVFVFLAVSPSNLLSPPSYFETCTTTTCTRNFLWNPSNNLPVFYFLVSEAEGLSLDIQLSKNSAACVFTQLCLGLWKCDLWDQRKVICDRAEGEGESSSLALTVKVLRGKFWSFLSNRALTSDSVMSRHPSQTKHCFSFSVTGQCALLWAISVWPWHLK